ncbi:KUP/HAK/KT family potassium transporter [Aureimonas jatrophae]|uniref:Probable potassium transport system protein Kup n=1 Tax=Aureimonas jatrophae TaxID=1166073 RepID=A0A1H0CSQ3_9HYPH|nr:KUP/HAK/KT family potassium transporter [Aureimonas jatrophae]MBB3949373.1 KUP system potassium uptake protein [Aureimonas jatrophae]SDN60937.1 KUP system potassium uptake protein [Aureimonas jatrophae]
MWSNEAKTGPQRATAWATVGALGVVFGDIGTSPLYALQEGVRAASVEGTAAPASVLGVLSLVTWALILVVTLKYVSFILRADNEGEGGILALVTLLRVHQGRRRGQRVLLALGLAGAAMLFGDGVLTPAISVLSAMEGIRVVAPSFDRFIVPATVAVLLAVFVLQRLGTAPIARFFGPVMLLWFAALGGFGVVSIVARPDVLAAANPLHGVALLLAEPGRALAIMGSVFLAVTGGEALYADLGQFGRRTIRNAWTLIALPALLLNYYGQGALFLGNPGVLHPFFEIVPAPFGLPMLVLATLATIIASQAILTGAFSLANQAVELGFLPPMRMRNTSAHNEADVYIGRVNWLIGILAIAVVVSFGSSERLASAYGIAVALAMVTTTILFVFEMGRSWRLPRWGVLAIGALFLCLDLPFATANLTKILDGGLLPLSIGGVVLLVMGAWRHGLKRLRSGSRRASVPIQDLPARLAGSRRLPRPAVFITRTGETAPVALVRMRKLADVSFSPTIVCVVRRTDKPRVLDGDRAHFSRIADDIVRVDIRFGYMQRLNLPSVLVPLLRDHQIPCDELIYVTGMDRAVPSERIRSWSDILDRIFAFLFDTAERPIDRFGLPETRTVAFGTSRHI